MAVNVEKANEILKDRDRDRDRDKDRDRDRDRDRDNCPQLPGTILRINIPAGAVINLLGLIEVSSPSGICLIIRLPILGNSDSGLSSIINTIEAAGGTVEFVND